MGSGHWDSKLYNTSYSVRAASGVADFAHSDKVMSAPRHERKAHKELDPLKIKETINHVRESRDSKDHPESRAIAVLFDVTGSMGDVPRTFQKNLNKLMSLLILKGKIEHPQLLIGGIGDATCDTVPLQISQFESDNLIDEHIRKIVIEGGGGGHITESYELGLYAMARLTELDCLDKRGKKGYLFLSGDEIPYPAVKHEEVKKIFGIPEQADIPLEDIFAEVQKKYEVYFIIPEYTQHSKESVIHDTWAKYLGQHVLHLDDPSAICELIASTVATEEGLDIADIMENLKVAGTTAKVRNTVKKTLTAVK